MDVFNNTPISGRHGLIRVGVTGTRSSITEAQFLKLRDILRKIHETIGQWHHGDCVGADAETHVIARSIFNPKFVIHPPEKDSLRAGMKGDEVRSPFTYFERNRNIVEEVDILFVFPYQTERQTQGGTWYTYDYAKKKQVPRMIFWPDGTTKFEA